MEHREEAAISILSHVPSVEYNTVPSRTELLIRIESPNADLRKRRPLHLVCVLDRSGSMRGVPCQTLKHAMYDLIGRMDPRNLLSIVSYASDCTVDLSMVQMDPKNKELAIRAVQGMCAEGQTNLSGGAWRVVSPNQRPPHRTPRNPHNPHIPHIPHPGLMLGLEELAVAVDAEHLADAAVMLLTDGKPNVGPKSAERLAASVRRCVR